MISFVGKNELDFIWTKFESKIKEALKYGEGENTTSGYLYDEVVADRMLMIVAHEGDNIEACGIISIQEHPARKTIYVELLAGLNLNHWIDEVDDMLHKIKTHYGAEAVQASCRPGLVRMLKRWKPKSTIMELT